MTKGLIKKASLLLLGILFYSPLCFAQVKDIPEKALLIVNKVNHKLELVQNIYSEYENAIQQVKTGISGSAMMQAYKDVKKAYENGKNLANSIKSGDAISIFSAFYDILEHAEVITERELANKVQEELQPTIGKGNDTEVLRVVKEKQEKIQQQNLSVLYAFALSSRFNIQSERDLNLSSDAPLNDGLSILQANRATSNRVAQRWGRILAMKAMVSEYNSTQNVRNSNVKSAYDLEKAPDSDLAPTPQEP